MKEHQTTHEDIQHSVVELLRGILKEVLEERKDEISSRLIENPSTALLVPVYKSKNMGAYRTLGSDIVFFIFEQKIEDCTAKYLDDPRIRDAKYFIVTNYKEWKIYKRNNDKDLKAIFTADSNSVRPLLKQIIANLPFKLYPDPETMVSLYTINYTDILNKLKDVFKNAESNQNIKSLYNAYKNIMKVLYGDVDEISFNDLFIKHTYIHMVILTSLSFALGKNGRLEDIANGSLLDMNVSLPYLNWWIFVKDDKRVTDILRDIYSKTILIDWEAEITEDIFRELYEELIDPDTRRKIGEYYTPPWLADFILEHLELKGKTVLDPFCGSGSFLVKAFHKKVDSGEDVTNAYNSVIGWDMNPLATTIARAELIIAYKRRAGREPNNPPHIYQIDTFGMWFGGNDFILDETKDFISISKEYLEFLINFNIIKLENILENITKIEQIITNLLKTAECETDAQCIKNKIDTYVEEEKKRSIDGFETLFLDHLKNISKKLVELIVKYNINNTWGTVIISAYAPILLARFKPDLILTNPPWAVVTEYKAPYINKVREYITKNIKDIIGERARNITSGIDVAIAALGKSLELAKEGVAFVMNREQLFYHKLSVAGNLATYCILKNNEQIEDAKIYDVDFDVFMHGIYPGIIVAKKSENGRKINGNNVELYIVELKPGAKRRYNKNLIYNELKDMLELRKYEKTYEEYIRPVKIYFTRNTNEMSKALSVDKVVLAGYYMRGVFGGEKKSNIRYAGLVLDSYILKDGGTVEFKLYNTESTISLPESFLKKYGVKKYELIYMRFINPFKLRRTVPVLLSERGQKQIKNFLNDMITVYEKELTKDDMKKIVDLAREFIQPGKIIPLSTNKWYTIYRGHRVFSALAFKPDRNDIIPESSIGYIETSNKDIAFYYAAVLNYLAFHAMIQKRSFMRDLFERPLLAVYLAGLSWTDLDQKICKKVAELSKTLHEKAPDKEYSNQKYALKEISELDEFKELANILDGVVNKNKLEEALEFISGGK